MRGFSVPTLMVPALALHSLLLVSSCSPDSREGQDKAIDSPFERGTRSTLCSINLNFLVGLGDH